MLIQFPRELNDFYVCTVRSTPWLISNLVEMRLSVKDTDVHYGVSHYCY